MPLFAERRAFSVCGQASSDAVLRLCFGQPMQLKDIRTFVVGNPPPHFGGRWLVFVKLTTNDNVSGIGESYGVPFHPQLVARMLEDVFGRYLAGQDPHDIETLWRRVYSSGSTHNPDLTMMGVPRA